ncbi:MAG TPA: ankyrin repeat domain-containing protein [Gemmatimonadaceae bacterium]|nr:ankyrin repeat domain-containing protein [Gemmatimonadaceae bacterium]
MSRKLTPPSTPESLRRFLDAACPDHHVRGGPAYVVARGTAERLLRRHPELARDGLVPAVVTGDLTAVQRLLAERPEAADERQGPKGWTPLLYLCFTRLALPAVAEHAVAIARLLLDHGADPNAYFMAGDSRYTPLVGVVGEGEEERPPHPRRDDLARLLLERGAEPYDLQVVYDIHFRGRVLWFLRLMHEHALRLGRAADWADPEWHMLDMGPYGSGARWHLQIALDHDDLALADWVLAHGASPNAAPARDPRLPQRSLHEEAVRRGQTALAELLVRHGATPSGAVADDESAFVAACLHLDRDEAARLARAHPEYLRRITAVVAAARQDRAEVMQLLLDLGMSTEVEDGERRRPLHIAAMRDAPRMAALLIARGAGIDPVEATWHNTPLDFAVYHQLPRIIELLAPHSRDVWNLAFTGHVARLREVLAAAPELARVANANDATPLYWLPDDEARAAEVVALFLAHGADPATRRKDGATAADVASRRGLDAAAALLRTAMAGA